ncbi:MAG: Cd(II)/Pb(II)-responsive transcriptional regulator [Magnetococcales bacterium]|nr:Cd(II)/Pb(II)-responsive transcriptional regulator [Magnetococcales bacterium]MBF0117089.1 Cd(II)/Pb(II)-responsive transcriptional regulator [Magnetococcales bacterium]
MRIGELAKRTGCEVETVRYYEKEGLLTLPQRDGSGYRNYSPQQLEELQFIRHCRSLGMPLTEIRALLRFRYHPQWDCAGVNAIMDTQIARVEEQMRGLQSLLEQLHLLRKECIARQQTKECGIMRNLNQAAKGEPCQCHPLPEKCD